MTRFLALTMVLLLSACASAPDTTVDQLSKIAATRLGTQFMLYQVGSEGSVADASFISMSKSTGTSGMAKQLAKLLSDSKDTRVKLAVGGPNAMKTAQVLGDALQIVSPEPLPGLELLYIGEQAYAPALAESSQALGARFEFAPLTP